MGRVRVTSWVAAAIRVWRRILLMRVGGVGGHCHSHQEQVMPFDMVARAITRRYEPPTDHRLDPQDGDDIDELVNEQLQRGKADRR
jgi:hypothetical protein